MSISLPNNCSYTGLKVHPKNWKSKKALLNTTWYIYYRFTDPNHSKPKLVVIKGMNRFQERYQRIAYTELLIENEKNNLEVLGYNPITKTITNQISQEIKFIDSIDFGLSKLKTSDNTLREIKIAMEVFKKASNDLFPQLMLSQVRRKNIVEILDFLQKTRKQFNAPSFNRYRAYVSMIFSELIQHDYIDINPVTFIKKQKETKKEIILLTDNERKVIDDHLKKRSIQFRNFVRIFFNSGCRLTELMEVKVADVNIENRRFQVPIKKGKVNRIVYKPIQMDSLDLWSQLVKNQPEDYYVFSRFLKPGPNKIGTREITRRWKIYVKDELGIDKNLYWLKHLHTTEVSNSFDTTTAALINSHTSNKMVETVYDVNFESRKLQKLSKLDIKFS
jgi:integrase